MNELDAGMIKKLGSSELEAVRFLAAVYEPVMETIDSAAALAFGPEIFALNVAGGTTYRETLAGTELGDTLFIATLEGGTAYAITKLAQFIGREAAAADDIITDIESSKRYALNHVDDVADDVAKGSTAGIPFEQGGGFKVNWDGDRILQYHPAGLNHHGNPSSIYSKNRV